MDYWCQCTECFHWRAIRSIKALQKQHCLSNFLHNSNAKASFQNGIASRLFITKSDQSTTASTSKKETLHLSKSNSFYKLQFCELKHGTVPDIWNLLLSKNWWPFSTFHSYPFSLTFPSCLHTFMLQVPTFMESLYNVGSRIFFINLKRWYSAGKDPLRSPLSQLTSSSFFPLWSFSFRPFVKLKETLYCIHKHRDMCTYIFFLFDVLISSFGCILDNLRLLPD